MVNAATTQINTHVFTAAKHRPKGLQLPCPGFPMKPRPADVPWRRSTKTGRACRGPAATGRRRLPKKGAGLLPSSSRKSAGWKKWKKPRDSLGPGLKEQSAETSRTRRPWKRSRRPRHRPRATPREQQSVRRPPRGTSRAT